MEIHWSILFALEAVGTVAFASSGAMTAIDKNLDLLGVIVLGVTTAVGGGMIRDIIIGKVPPSLFVNPIYVLMALVTVLLLFAVIRFHSYLMSGFYRQTYDKIMNLFDAVGLGAFTVVGIDTAVSAGFGGYRFLAVFLGVITGVGGRHPPGHHGRPDPLRPLQARVRLRLHRRRPALHRPDGSDPRRRGYGDLLRRGGADPAFGRQIPLESAQGHWKT